MNTTMHHHPTISPGDPRGNTTADEFDELYASLFPDLTTGYWGFKVLYATLHWMTFIILAILIVMIVYMLAIGVGNIMCWLKTWLTGNLSPYYAQWQKYRQLRKTDKDVEGQDREEDGLVEFDDNKIWTEDMGETGHSWAREDLPGAHEANKET